MEPNDDLPNVHAPFSAAEAKQLGLTSEQLRGKGFVQVSQGIHRPTDWDFDFTEAARALSAQSPGAWISHVSAARIHGLVLPPWLSDSAELHLSKPRMLPEVRRTGITGHNVLACPDEVEQVGDLWISTRARTWLDMARILPLPDLVCMGDQLVRMPRPEFEDRSTAFATLNGLWKLVGRHSNLQGIVRAREALGLMRVGSDSSPETLLRLAMLDAGLPEPELQISLWDRQGAPSADAGYRGRRIALQYDGAHHLEELQRHRDRRRNKAFQDAGWTVLVFTQEDYADGFKEAVLRIRDALKQPLKDPAITSGFASGG